MSPSFSTPTKASPAIRDLSIIGDYIKYFFMLFVPFFLIGAVYGFLNSCYFMCLLLNPIIYAGGIAAIIIVIQYDVNDILDLIGLAGQPQLALHIRYATTIQQISLLMSSRDYEGALKKVSRLLKEEPDYANALNLKGQILLEGFREYDESRSCFAKVMKLTKPDSDDYKLAQALKAATFQQE